MASSSFYKSIGLIGFLLSPLSWWNDPFVNVPLAWFFAWIFLQPFRLFTSPTSFWFFALMSFSYFLTNVLGFWMMQYSVRHLVKLPRISHGETLIATTVFTLIVILLSWQVPAFSQAVLPSWVK